MKDTPSPEPGLMSLVSTAAGKPPMTENEILLLGLEPGDIVEVEDISPASPGAKRLIRIRAPRPGRTYDTPGLVGDWRTAHQNNEYHPEWCVEGFFPLTDYTFLRVFLRQEVNCPTCGARVSDVFQHVDGCPEPKKTFRKDAGTPLPCDGSGPHQGHEVRVLPVPGGNKLNLCRACSYREILLRRKLNLRLSEADRLPLPAWQSLELFEL